MLFLTEKGEEQIVQIRESLGQWRSAATEGMTDEEVEILARLLTQMKENVSKL
jgi:DNA-binding MarR family transcriptional regulator